MDLFAYAQIDNIDEIAKANGIDIPRLRGYRLMKNEAPVPQSEIDKLKKDAEVEVADDLICAEPRFTIDPWCYGYSRKTDCFKKYYLTWKKCENGYIEFTGIRWDRIHGKRRKNLKYVIKQQKRAIQKNFDTWNKYAGKEGVLYIHSRTGGNNWTGYLTEKERKEILTAPWFLDRVDDWWDNTYCDYYAKIDLSIQGGKDDKK